MSKSYFHKDNKAIFLIILIFLQSFLILDIFNRHNDLIINAPTLSALDGDSTQVLLLEQFINRSLLTYTGSISTVIDSSFFSLGGSKETIFLFETSFDTDFSRILSQISHPLPLNPRKFLTGLASNTTHFWVIEHESIQYNTSVEYGGYTDEVYQVNLLGFTRDGTIFQNHTLKLDDLYSSEYIQELWSYAFHPEPLDLPLTTEMHYFNGSLFILHSNGYLGQGLIQLDSTSLKLVSRRSFAFLNYDTFLVYPILSTFDIDDRGRFWARVEKVSNSAYQEIYSFNANGHYYQILDTSLTTEGRWGNFTDYDLTDSLQYIQFPKYKLDLDNTMLEYTIANKNKVIKPITASGSIGEMGNRSWAEILVGFLLYSIKTVPFSSPWVEIVVLSTGIGLCGILVIYRFFSPRKRAS